MSEIQLPNTRQENWRWNNLRWLESLSSSAKNQIHKAKSNNQNVKFMQAIEGARESISVFSDSERELCELALCGKTTSIPDVYHDRITPIKIQSNAPHEVVNRNMITRVGSHVNACFEVDTASANAQWTNAWVHCKVESTSTLDVILPSISESQVDSALTLTLSFDLEASSRVRLHTFLSNRSFQRVDVLVRLRGTNSTFLARGLNIAGEHEEQDIHLHCLHQAPKTRSHQEHVGIAGHHGHTIWKSLATIERGAHGSESFQRNDNRLLGNKARVSSKPELKIDEDDVKASHGSATGRVNEDAYFYCRQRGLSPRDAKALLLEAFVEKSFDDLSSLIDKDALAAKVERALGKVIYEE